MNELDALRQEAETLKNAIRVSEIVFVGCLGDFCMIWQRCGERTTLTTRRILIAETPPCERGRT